MYLHDLPSESLHQYQIPIVTKRILFGWTCSNRRVFALEGISELFLVCRFVSLPLEAKRFGMMKMINESMMMGFQPLTSDSLKSDCDGSISCPFILF